MKLIAKTKLNYRQRELSPGDAFEAKTQDARLLVAIGRATERVEDEAEPKEQPKRRGRPRKLPQVATDSRRYQTRELSAEDA